MDQIKIGKFIAECRKKVNLTQMQLADKLSITDKAISKWERGISMPDTSIMLELCDILGISVNELLCGEKIVFYPQGSRFCPILLLNILQVGTAPVLFSDQSNKATRTDRFR